MSKNGKEKCKKVIGMKSILYNDKCVYYKNLEQLSKKLKISKRLANKLIKEDGRRIIINDKGEVEVTNIKKENPRGLLKRDFGVKKVSNKDLIEGRFFKNKEVEILNELGPEEEVENIMINLEFYFSFLSPFDVRIDNLMSLEGLNKYKEKLEEKGYKVQINDYIKIKIDGKEEMLHSMVIKNKKNKPESVYEYLPISSLENKYVIKKRLKNLPLYSTKTILTYSGKIKDIKNFIKNNRIIKKKIRDYEKQNGNLAFLKITLGSTFRNEKLKFEDGYIRDFGDEYKLTEWANIQYNYSNKKGDTCAVSFISKRFPSLYWDIKKIEEEHGVKIKNFIDFLIKNKISHIIYDEHGNKKIENKISDNIGSIKCIIYNNHLYPISGGKLKKIPKKKLDLEIHNDDSKFKEYIENKHLPSNIKINTITSHNKKNETEEIEILSYIVKNKKFINNKEYNKCLCILKKMGIDRYINDNTRINDIPKIYEKANKIISAYSFFPEKYMWKMKPLLYRIDEDIDYSRQITTIDMNKCYAYCLYSLPYLITFDFRKNFVNTKVNEITDNYLYNVKVKYFTTLMPMSGLYPGYMIKYCKKIGIEFEILEELETVTVPNYYRELINLTYENMESGDFKKLWNVLIGKFERDIEECYYYKYKGIYNEESSKHMSGFTHKIGDHNLFFEEKKKIKYCRDKIPIALQVKHMCRKFVYEKINEIGIDDEDIIQIRTDAITYYGKPPKNLNSKSWGMWKLESNKIMDNVNLFDLDPGLIINNSDKPPMLSELKNDSTKIRRLYSLYAGGGKTTRIINKIIPSLNEKCIKYKILTPSHKTLSEYKKLGLNCEIIQKYCFDETIPEEDYIIIDEIGFVDLSCHDFLYKLFRAGKNYECFGDFNQLLPVGESEPSDKYYYINFMFNEIRRAWMNYRNNFSKEYYNKILNEEIDIINEVKKYSKPIEEAEIIICYRTEKSSNNKTRDVYNDKILKKMNLESDSIGVKVICTTNKLINIDIYNHRILTIVDKKYDKNLKECIYTLKDNDEIFKINYNKLKSNFRPAYCINVYEAQGSTFDSYHWAVDDDKFLTGRMAYTIISRIRQNVKYDSKKSKKYLKDTLKEEICIFNKLVGN